MSYKCKVSVLTIFLAFLVTSAVTNTVNAESFAYIELIYGNEVFVYKDEYVEPTNHLVEQELFERKINEPLTEKLELVQSKLKGGADYKSALLTCFPLLENTVKKAALVINALPQDSQIRFDPYKAKMFAISREKNGVRVLEDRLYMDLYFALLGSNNVRLKIPTETVRAQTTALDNIELTNLRARYTTDFSSSGSGRKHNIALALSKINGLVLGGGKTVSFNETVGSRTAKNGFHEAKIIVGGKYVSGVGGGVCQVSTTLYNAALLSDLQILEVNAHSLQSSYELPSFDAMVNSGSSDLRIYNQGSRPVFVKAYQSGDKACVEIYGSKLPYVIKRKSEVTFTGKTPRYDEIVDENLQYFEDGTESGTRKTLSYSHPEVRSNGYLYYYDKRGAIIEIKLIRSDKYNSVNGVIAIAP